MGQPFALRFLAGKLQGTDLSLEEMADELILGRAKDAAVVLDETMVSRRHARLYVEDGVLQVQDLGSTNGTFVNGQRVQRAALKEGDRILVGTSLMKLISADAMEGTAKLQVSEGTARLTLPPAMFDPTATSTAVPVAGSLRFSGVLEEIPLLDLIQLLSTSKKGGVLEVRGPQGSGSIHLRNGQVTDAALSGHPDLRPDKAVYRMLAWQAGSFELKPPDGRASGIPLADRTEGLVLEAMRQLDELRRIEDRLPALEARLVLVHPMLRPLRDLGSDQLDVLQLVHNVSQVGAILDKSPLPDLETYEALLRLLKSGYITLLE
jgi:pSer/pThr/pTyr-binding forkhead associated (FHA) protein